MPETLETPNSERITLHEPPSPSLFRLSTLKALMRKPNDTAEATTLPSKRLCIKQQKVDPEKLAKFQKVCGYAQSKNLPISFLHLAAFDLQWPLLTDESMPLPLLGLVHLENSITRFKDFNIDEQFDVEAYISNKKSHRLGLTFDLCCNISIDSEVVWSESSKTLCRLPKNLRTKMPDSDNQGQPEKQEKTVRPCSEQAKVWRAPSNTGRLYASVSGDRNPIHLWPLTAKPFGFRRHIAHGMWTLARAAAEFESTLFESTQTEKAIRYEAQFIKPVFLPAKLHYYQAQDLQSKTNATETKDDLKIEVWNPKASHCHMSARVAVL